MRRRRWSVMSVIVVALVLSVGGQLRDAQAAAKKKGAAVVSSKGHGAKRASVKRLRRAPRRLSSTAELTPAAKPSLVPPAEISPAAVEAIASGDVSGALLAMREEPDSPKLFHLMRAATTILEHELTPKVSRAEAHQVYQNAGIAYHNLYLFLRARGVEQQAYAKEAHSLYRKARRAGTPMHRADSRLLEAALLAARGERDKAEKIYAGIDEEEMRGDFESMEYLAAYHAAAGHIEGAVAALDAAHRLGPDALLTWLAVGDDFHTIASDPQYQALLVTWKVKEASKNLKLTLPRGEKPRLRVAEEEHSFRPQKEPARHALKKARKGKQPVRAPALAKKKQGPKAAVAKNSAAKGSAKGPKPAAAKKAAKASPTKKAPTPSAGKKRAP